MTTVEWLDDDEQRAWRSYLDATRLLLRNLDRQLVRDAGISFTDYELLVLLSEAPDRRLRMSELADAVTSTRGGVTKAVTRLVNAGWVRRVAFEGDRRGTFAELTEDGVAKLAETSAGHVAAVRRNMFDLLSPEDVRVFGKVYEQMRAQMSADPGSN